MISAKIQELLLLLLSVQYNYGKDVEFDYSNQPRPCHNLVFMLEGQAVIQSDGETIKLQQGDILFIPKNTTYRAKWSATPKATFHSLHFSFQVKHDPFLNESIPVQILDNSCFSNLYSLLKDIERYQFSKNTDSFLALSAFYGICGKLLANIKINAPIHVNTLIAPAIAYIQKNHKKHFSVETLANLCNVSSSRFYCVFKQQTGDSPIVYKNKIAIQNAAQELLYNKELSVKELAVKYGFVSPIYFERQFKKLIGKTPSQYRKEESLL